MTDEEMVNRLVCSARRNGHVREEYAWKQELAGHAQDDEDADRTALLARLAALRAVANAVNAGSDWAVITALAALRALDEAERD